MALSPAFEPGEPPAGADLSISAWNLMGGIEWAAIPIVAEMLGIEDVERLVHHLIAIRDHQRKVSEAQHG